VPALPEAARLLSAAHGVPTLRTPDLQNKRQTAQILTSHQDLTITSAAARPPLQRQGVSRLACRLLDSSREGMKTGSRGRRYGFSVRSLECAEKRSASWRKRSRASVPRPRRTCREPVPGSHGLAVAAGLRSLLGLRVTLGILGDGDLRSFTPRLESEMRHHSQATNPHEQRASRPPT
jgi:hypothetical protein